jgi:polyribonucleotide 5'-hydroxyl-kinase
VADPLRITPVVAGLDLMHSLVAVSHATVPDQILSYNVAGFLYISDVDVQQHTVTFLAPCPGPLPGKYLLTGNIKVLFE